MKKIIFILVLSSLLNFPELAWAEVAELLPLEAVSTEEIIPEIQNTVEALDEDTPLEVQTEMLSEEPTPKAQFGHIVIANGGKITEKDVLLPAEGNSTIVDTEGNSKEINARSVLALVYALDKTDDSFEISELTYYSSFDAFYLRCINVSGEKKCDNWLYKVDDKGPSVGMDSYILSGGENIEVYFSSFFEEPAKEETNTEHTNRTSRSSKKIRDDGVEPKISEPEKETLPEEVASTPVLPMEEEQNKVEPVKIARARKTTIVSADKVDLSPVLTEVPLTALAQEGGTSVPPYIYISSIAVLVSASYFVRRRMGK